MDEYRYHCMFCRNEYTLFPQGGRCPKCNFPLNQFPINLQGPEEDALLVKIGSEYALNNMRKGNFWLQSPKFFQVNYENEARDDRHESAFEYVELNPEFPEGLVVSKPFANQNKYRILCFGYVFVHDGCLRKPDDRMRLFGTHFSYVNTHRLMEAFERAAKVKDAKFDFGGVHYLGSHYKGIYTPFCKMPRFAYQEEQRVAFYSERYALMNECEKDTVSLGDISDWFSKPVPIDVLFQEHTLEVFSDIILD